MRLLDRYPVRSVLLALMLLVVAPAFAGTDSTDDFLAQYSATYRFRLGHPTEIRSTPDGRTVLFLRSGPRSFVHDLWAFDIESGKERRLLSAAALLGDREEELTTEEKARRERQRLSARGIVSYEISPDGKRLLVPLSGRLFIVELGDEKVKELESDGEAPIDPQWSPDGRSVSSVRGGELYVTDIRSGTRRRLTSGGGGTVTNGLAEFVAQEEMSRHHGYWWSPDSKHIAYQQTDTVGLEVMNIMDPTSPEKAPDRWPYPRPGKRNARVRLGIVPSGGGETRWIDWDQERYEYLTQVTWEPESPLTLAVQNRRQTELALLAVDPLRGTTSTLLKETDAAWVDIDERMPFWLPDGQSFLWTTERNGAWQLELRNRDGSLSRTLTPTALGFRKFEHFFEGRGDVVVRASAYPPASQLYRVSLAEEAAPAVPWTQEPGQHEANDQRTGPVMIRRSRLLNGLHAYNILGADGAILGSLESRAEKPILTPNLELTTVGGKPEFHAALLRPDDFDPNKRYPVIVHVYGGPTSLMVRADPGRYLLDQWMANHGYIVVAIDGRGTPGRGRRWQRAVKHDLISTPLEDQVRALQLLGQKYEELDLTRVGVYGWSFGGYFSAMALMRRPDVFHVGVAGAPVVDWMDYDTHYTERYMDLPERNPSGYEASNALTYAEKLTRPLLIIHGTSDDNVYFMHSLKLADALFKAGKPFDFLPLPGFTHMVPDPQVTRRLYERILHQFDSHLKPAAPCRSP